MKLLAEPTDEERLEARYAQEGVAQEKKVQVRKGPLGTVIWWLVVFGVAIMFFMAFRRQEVPGAPAPRGGARRVVVEADPTLARRDYWMRVGGWTILGGVGL